jgi:hypothetical protein
MLLHALRYVFNYLIIVNDTKLSPIVRWLVVTFNSIILNFSIRHGLDFQGVSVSNKKLYENKIFSACTFHGD